MSVTELIFPLLKNLAFQFPILMVLLSTIIIVWNKCALGKLRNTAIVAFTILLLDRLSGVGLSVLPILFSGYDSLRLFSIMSGLWFVLFILQAVAFGLLGWVLVKALPQNQSNHN